MKIFNIKFNSSIFHLTIIFYLYNLSDCITLKQRKELLNYLLGRETSYLVQNLKDEEVFKPLTFFTEESQLFQKYLKATLEENTSADPNCLFSLLEAYESNIFPTMKLIRDSSHSLSKLGSYQDCKYKNYYDPTNESISSNNISYNYILFYNAPDEVCLRPVLFSLCVPNATDCRKEDYSNLLETFNMKTEFIDTSYIGGIDIYILDESSKKLNDNFYIGIIVVSFCLIIILFGFFPGIPIFLFKCCFKKKSKKMEIYETSALIQLEKSFDIKESIAEIYGTGIGYDSGISFIKGLRGIILFFFILGNTLEAVYQYPLQKDYNQYFNSNSLSFLFFFDRSGKSVFLSLSAFTLCFKILCFFDNEIERKELKKINIKLGDINPDFINNSLLGQEKSKKRKKSKPKKKKSSDGSPNSSKSNSNSSGDNSQNLITNTSKRNTMTGSNTLNSTTKLNTSRSSSGDLSKMPSMSKFNTGIAELKFYNKLTFKSFLIFFFRQFYKFLLFIIVVLFYKFFYYDFVSITTQNPMWEFIKNSYVNKLKPKYICSLIFLYFPFYPEANNEIKYDFFDIIILEISVFILFSLVLFIFYKYNWRLDIVLIVLFIIGLVIKVIAYLVNIKDEEADIYEDYFYPAKGFTNKKYKLIINNPLYFIPSISLGLFFGLVNYAIQKSAKSIKDFRDKLYLTIPIWFINKLKKKAGLYSIIFFLMFIAYFIWSGLSYNALFLSEKKLSEDAKANEFFENKSINIYYSLDVDIFVLMLYIAIIPFILIGENIISSFLEHEFWNIFSRPYFSFMLLVQTVGNNILYRMNTYVSNNIWTIIFFAIINIISSIIFGMLIYILLEVPLKKVNKFIFRKRENEEDNEDNNEKKGKNEISQVMDRLSKQDDKDDDGDEKILFADF